MRPKNKVDLSDIVLSVMKQMQDWEPIGKQSLKLTVVTEQGGKMELSKDRKSFEKALQQTTERHGGALKKLADK